MAEQAGFEGAARGAAAAVARDLQVTERPDEYLVFEVTTVEKLAGRMTGEVAERPANDTRILVLLGTRTPENAKRSISEILDQAILDQAQEDDLPGRRYAAIRSKHYLEKTPTKDVKTTWT